MLHMDRELYLDFGFHADRIELLHRCDAIVVTCTAHFTFRSLQPQLAFDYFVYFRRNGLAFRLRNLVFLDKCVPYICNFIGNLFEIR